MIRTGTTSVRMLQAVSLVASLAILLWSLGLPQLHLVAEAANITTVSDTLSDSDRSVASNHTITFSVPSGVANGESITITFPNGFNISTSGVAFDDIDVATTTDYVLAASCGGGGDQIGASISSQTLTLEFCSGEGARIDAYGTTTIQIGSNATGGNNQITNHGTAGSYEIDISAGSSDSGSTRIVILDDVQVTAAVDTIFDFTVSGFPTITGVDVNGTSSNATSSATEIPFGTLSANSIVTAAQVLNVSTNATKGFVVTVQQSQDLRSSTGADIDGFTNGTYTNTPINWTIPSSTIGSEETYGHWGVTSADDLNSSEFQNCSGSATGCWVAASTTPRQIFENNGAADGQTANVGSTTVGYQVEVGSLQEAADDYSTTITYVATPTF